MDLAEIVGRAFSEAFPGESFQSIRVVPATDAKFGDYQCNDALKLAKSLKKNPREVGAAVAEKLALAPQFEKVEVAGPGFLNLTVSQEWLSDKLRELSASPVCGIEQRGAGKTVVIDYSSPNAAKPMHIGHIRSTVIGSAIDRIFRALGYRVIADNHLGDWGTQFGILIKGYRECLTDEERENLTVANLEKCYVLSAAKAKEEDGVWKEACRAELVKLQQGDADNLALWKRFIDISIAEFERMYALLGVKFDTYRGESYYNAMMPGVVEKLLAAGLAVESEGALVVKLEEEKLGVAIVRKSDGGYNYTTSDLACVASREADYSPERIIYVTDDRQQLHFKQFFSIAAKMGSKTNLVHVPFGLMSYQGKAISTREGNLIKLDDLLAEAVRRSADIVKARAGEEGSDSRLAEQIGYGAVKYADLSHDPATAIDFDWDKALALEGNSGPYLQYAYARVCSLLAKSGGAPEASEAGFAVSSPSEKRLALAILEFPNVVVRAAEAYKPSILAEWLFQTAQAYSSFYQNSPILRSEEPLRSARLRLCELFGRTLKTGLGLLGIETPEHI
ncbi:MAG: arginine--tRNA ligase [Kiritimatiellae bacterium]|nr:arginine--tRNA ligase [Kiritimatiellia bacterium]